MELPVILESLPEVKTGKIRSTRTDTDTDTHSDTQTHRHTDTQTQTTQTQTHRHTDTDTDSDTDTETDTDTDKDTDTGRHTDTEVILESLPAGEAHTHSHCLLPNQKGTPPTLAHMPAAMAKQEAAAAVEMRGLGGPALEASPHSSGCEPRLQLGKLPGEDATTNDALRPRLHAPSNRTHPPLDGCPAHLLQQLAMT